MKTFPAMNIGIMAQSCALLTGVFATSPVRTINCIYVKQAGFFALSAVWKPSGKPHGKPSTTCSSQTMANSAGCWSLTKQGDGQKCQGTRDAQGGAYS